MFSLEKGAGIEFLKALVVASENPGCVVAPEDATSHAAACVAAALADRELFSVLGGREGIPWALGSAHAGRVILCLGMGVRSTPRRTMVLALDDDFWAGGFAVTSDGSTLLVTDLEGALRTFSVADGSFLRTIGSRGTGRLQFMVPRQVCVAPDGFVFVADFLNHRIQVLTPKLEFHSSLDGIYNPIGVCANAAIVAVFYMQGGVLIYCRAGGALLRSFDVNDMFPAEICFLGDDAIAAADIKNHRICIFSVKGEFLRSIGQYYLHAPNSISSSACGEIIVAVYEDDFVLINAGGDIVSRVHRKYSDSKLALHGRTIYALSKNLCRVFE